MLFRPRQGIFAQASAVEKRFGCVSPLARGSSHPRYLSNAAEHIQHTAME